MIYDRGMSFVSNITPNPLSRRRKAAIVVQILIADGGRLPLSDLPEPLQEILTAELANLRLLDRVTMDAVATEFAAELDQIGMTAAGGQDAALAALADHLSPDLAHRLQAQRDAQRSGDAWPAVVAMPVARLTQIMQAESIEICAVALSKLPVAKAAEVLQQTPGDRARRITYAMSLTADVTPDVVQRIGQALAQNYRQQSRLAFEKAPVQRLGAILNAATTDTRDDLLDGLGAQDAVFARDVRRAIFTFKDIPSRLKPTDIATCLRAVDPPVLTTAMAAALASDADIAATADFILANISQRMAGQLRDDAAELGAISPADADKAMAAITRAVRDLVDNGAISLLAPDIADGDP